MRHKRIQPLLQYGCVALRMRFFSQNFGIIKRILPGSSSRSHREGPGIEVGADLGIFVRESNLFWQKGVVNAGRGRGAVLLFS